MSRTGYHFGNQDIRREVDKVLERKGWIFDLKKKHAILIHVPSGKKVLMRLGSKGNRAETPHQIRQNAQRIEREYASQQERQACQNQQSR